MDDRVAAPVFLLQNPLRVRMKYYSEQTRFNAATIDLHLGTG
jgi:hypothetical protein